MDYIHMCRRVSFRGSECPGKTLHFEHFSISAVRMCEALSSLVVGAIYIKRLFI